MSARLRAIPFAASTPVKRPTGACDIQNISQSRAVADASPKSAVWSKKSAVLDCRRRLRLRLLKRLGFPTAEGRNMRRQNSNSAVFARCYQRIWLVGHRGGTGSGMARRGCGRMAPMPWSVTVGRFGGTAVKIHITFLLFLVWIAASAWARGGSSAALDSTLFIVLIFLCVVLHEFGHILAARRYGIQSPEVTLLPIGGVASMPRLPPDPRQELVVALAGPAVNLVIGLALALARGLAQARRARPRSTIPACRWSAGSPRPTSFSPCSTSSPPFRWTAGGCCTPCSRCGSAERWRPRSPPRSARPSPSASAFSACSAIRSSSSSRSSSTWLRPAKRR